MNQFNPDLRQHLQSVAAERLSHADRVSRVWVFREREHVYARQVGLLPDDRISGHYHPNEHGGTLRHGRLAFLDMADRITTVFDRVTRDDGGALSMSSDVLTLDDDDLMIGWRDINALFSISANLDLAIAQPALGAGSEITQDITRRQDGVTLRYTPFVEAMAPCFSRAALALCMPVFDRQALGWGSDHVWARLIGPPQGRVAIIDAISMMQTRPLASSSSWDAAKAEEAALLDAYGLRPEVREDGRITY